MDYKKIIKSRKARELILNSLYFIPDKTMIKLQYRIKTGRKLSRISQNAEPTEKMQMESKIEDLIYYRDNLQIEDKKNIQKVLNELIPEYKAEQEKQRAKRN